MSASGGQLDLMSGFGRSRKQMDMATLPAATRMTPSGHTPDRNPAAQHSPAVPRCAIFSVRKYGRSRTVKGGAAGEGRQAASLGGDDAETIVCLARGADLGGAGLPDQEADTMQGLVPAGTPRPIIDVLHREIVKAMALPMKEKMAALGFEPAANTPEEFAARIKAEIPNGGKP